MSVSGEVEQYRRDPVAFVRDFLRDPETGKPFVLYPAEEQFLRLALTLTPEGRLPFPELLYGAIKKSGKTMIAAWCVLYVVLVIGGPYAEAYCLANDEEQAQSRVFEAIVRLLRANPALKREAKITERKITFPATGGTITALASDYAGAAGAAPAITVFDELWAYASERAQRLWDEMIPVPTRKVSIRLTVTYAGFEGESKLLEGLYQRGLKGDQVAPALYSQQDLLMFWSHEPVAPWQSLRWLAQMRLQLRPNAYLRMIENRFVSGETSFAPIEWWDRAAMSQPVATDREMRTFLGVDAALRHDSAAVVACTLDASNKVRVVHHRIFQPGRGETLDLEETLEATVLDFVARYRVREVRFDPYQFQRSAKTLEKAGVRMVEYNQTLPNLTQMSTNLYELMRGGNLVAYPDPDIRLAMQRAVAVETSRGLKISKEKASHKIDVVVALAMAALAAVENPALERVDLAPSVLTRTGGQESGQIGQTTWNPGRSRYRRTVIDLDQGGFGGGW
jgi:hypothetical protein